MKPRDLSAFSRVCRKYGITKLSLDGAKVDITFEPGFTPPTPLTPKQLAVEQELKQILEASDEEIALYSSPAPEEN